MTGKQLDNGVLTIASVGFAVHHHAQNESMAYTASSKVNSRALSVQVKWTNFKERLTSALYWHGALTQGLLGLCDLITH